MTRQVMQIVKDPTENKAMSMRTSLFHGLFNTVGRRKVFSLPSDLRPHPSPLKVKANDSAVTKAKDLTIVGLFGRRASQ